MASVKTALIVALVLVGTACGGNAATSSTSAVGDTVTITNQGGDHEGHTPTGFAGFGTGLFVGDNLNPSFPEGQGVQTFLTFALPDNTAVASAVVTSDALHTLGTPFDDLGSLLIEPISYVEFGPQLFDLDATGEPTRCTAETDTTIRCDVTDALVAATANGATTTQFRLRFEQPADNDGEPDLALFYRTDSNTNEPGLFELAITTGS